MKVAVVDQREPSSPWLPKLWAVQLSKWPHDVAAAIHRIDEDHGLARKVPAGRRVLTRLAAPAASADFRAAILTLGSLADCAWQRALDAI
jgi:hypothetical protein